MNTANTLTANQTAAQNAAFGPTTTFDPGAGKTTTIIDKDGNITGRTALGHESGVAQGFGHVAQVWVNKCMDWSKFYGTVKDQADKKFDVTIADENLRLNNDLTLKGWVKDQQGDNITGVEFTPHGIITLAQSAGLSKQMILDLRKMAETADAYPNAPHSSDRIKAMMAHTINTACDMRDFLWTNPSEGEASRRKQVRDSDGNKTGEIAARKSLLRLREGFDNKPVVRVVVSEKDTTELDNLNTLNLVGNSEPLRGRMDECLISHPHNDGDNVRGSILIPDHFATVHGSDYGIGIDFSNSETGMGICVVRPYLFRAQCVNGCIWGRKDATYFLSKKHLGDVNLIKLQLEMNDIIALALSHGTKFRDQMVLSEDVKIKEVHAVMMLLAKRHGITKPQLMAWAKAFNVEPETNAWGIVNGLTRAAHESFSGSIQQTLEGIGGEILSPSLDADLDTLKAHWARFEAQAKNDIKAKDLQEFKTLVAA